mmetsp:Transcript_29706/g.34471  ORF Transcript_29706/g.34471 Transcript_29706/m.34471 type:complete len:619 (-) Transcript_29706:227-2083(-)
MVDHVSSQDSLRSKLLHHLNHSINNHESTRTSNNSESQQQQQKQQQQCDDTNMNTRASTSATSNQTNRKSDIHHHISRNPQAILSHDPNQLSNKLGLTLNEIYSIRRKVAHSILEDDIVGNCLLSTSSSTSSSSSLSTCLIPGTATARDLYSNTSTCTWSSHHLSSHLSTGSKSLDQLLASTQASRKRRRQYNDIIITKSTYNEYEKGDEMNIDAYYEHHDNDDKLQQQGIQIGTITEVCGLSASGKTQLALSLAANAIMIQYNQKDDCLLSSSSASAAASAASSSLPLPSTQWKVEYFAAGGGSSSLFSLAKRFRQLCKVRLDKYTKLHGRRHVIPAPAGGDDDILERINFTPIGDNGYRLLVELNQLEKKLLLQPSSLEYDPTTSYSRNKITRTRTRKDDVMDMDDDKNQSIIGNNTLIIIDSISGCLSSYLYADGDGGAGAALMNEICAVLRRLSCITKISTSSSTSTQMMTTTTTMNELHGCGCIVVNRFAILVTNGMVTDGSGSGLGSGSAYKPALGESWRVADVRVILEHMNDIYKEREEVVVEEEETNSSTASYLVNKTKNSVKGLEVANKKRGQARLMKHFCKSCSFSSTETESSTVQFGIDGTGFVDAM